MASAPATVKPEDGYLSPTRYLNSYFGLSLTFPADPELVPALLSEVQGNTRWLLAARTMSTSPAALLVVTAGPHGKKDAASILRADFTDLEDKPRPVTIGGQSFMRVAVPRKPEMQQSQTVEYAGIVQDYVLRIRISTTSGEVPAALTEAIEKADFLAPEAIAGARTADMTDYEGPALPELGKPTDAISRLEAGAIDATHYRNDTLGIDFAIPQGLKPVPPGTLDEVSEPGQDKSRGRATAMEAQVSQTCTRRLLFAEQDAHRADGHLGPAVTLRAIDRLCMGGVRFPSSTSDTRDVRLVAGLLAERLHTPHSNDMRGRVYTLEGHVMLNVTGVYYGTDSGTGLRIANRVRLIATELARYWVLWTFIAPDTAALDRVANTSVRFYSASGLKSVNPSVQ